MDWQAAKDYVPWAERDEWSARMADNPDVLHQIIADAYDIALRDREHALGIQKAGRRPKPDPVSLDEVFDVAFPGQYSIEPFRVALATLTSGFSQRAFAKLVPCHQTTLSRLLSGKARPEMAMMERIAVAAGVGPWYFSEWRAAFAAQLVQRALMDDVQFGIRVINGIRDVT